MKNLIVVFAVLFMVMSCSKTRPRKVQRSLVDTEWKLTSYVRNGESIATTLTDYTYNFGEADLITVTTDRQILGSWKVGLDKNPTIVYLQFPSKDVDGLEVLSDDWKVVDLTKEYMRLEVVDTKKEKPTILVFRK